MVNQKSILFLAAIFLATLFFSFTRPEPSAAASTAVPQAIPYLVKDIELKDYPWSSIQAEMDGIVYFSSTDGVHGYELWRSDGTTAGTYMVKDINPGPGSSELSVMTVWNNILYFGADDGVHGYELWRSDGSAAGTYLLKDINPGPENSWVYNNLPEMLLFNGRLYFTADDGVHGYELWRTDGTTAGTQMVADINPGSEGSFASAIGVVGGALLLEAYTDDYGYELWRTNGTSAGTVLVKDIRPGADDSAIGYPPVIMNNLLYFGANDGNGSALWRSDGTATGTYPVAPAEIAIDVSNLAVMDDVLFFAAYDADHGSEFWKSDGTLEGTVMVKDINPGSVSSVPYYFTPVDDILFFTANDGVNGQELWQSDGTEAGTVLVKDIYPGSSDSWADWFTAAHGRLYFVANDGVNGRELWQSDGSEAGTVRLTDINPSSDLNLYELFAAGDRLFFGVKDTGNDGLWAVADPQTGPTFTVNTVSDVDNGDCTLGHCSLREAINVANAQAGQNTINFAPTASGVITLVAGLPNITQALIITGPGKDDLALSGGAFTNDPIMRVTSGTLLVTGLTFQNANNLPIAGGALLAETHLTLNGVRFYNNHGPLGGAVYMTSGGNIHNSEFDGNEATSDWGGAIAANNGVINIYNTIFTNNTAVAAGGAIYVQANFLNIYDSQFSDNSSSASNGGAIRSSAQTTIERSHFHGNHANGYGGGILLHNALANLNNLLLTENTAGDGGGAIYVTSGAIFNLRHATIAGVTRQPGSALYSDSTGTLNVTNSIVANYDNGLVRTDGTLSEDYNLFYDNETDRVGVSAGANSFNANPLFVNATGDYRLNPGSPAADAGTNVGVTNDFFNNPRPQGAGFDIGFNELAQQTITGPGDYGFAGTSVTMTVNQVGNLAAVQLVWIENDHPHANGAGGYWMIEGLNSDGQPATGFSLTLTLPHDNHPNPTVCRWTGSEWDCGRNGYNATHVWRNNVTVFSDWAVGEHQGYTLYLPLIVRP